MLKWLALAPLAGCWSTEVWHTNLDTLALGSTRQVTVVCEGSKECENPTWHLRTPRCRDVHSRCRLIEHGPRGDVTLLDGDLGIKPILFEPDRHLVWAIVNQKLTGIATSETDKPGARTAPPALVADSYGYEAQHITPAGVVIWKIIGEHFKLWEPSSQRAVEVVPLRPKTGGDTTQYSVGERAIGYCTFASESMYWTTIVIAEALASSDAAVTSGTQKGTAADTNQCATDHAR